MGVRRVTCSEIPATERRKDFHQWCREREGARGIVCLLPDPGGGWPDWGMLRGASPFPRAAAWTFQLHVCVSALLSERGHWLKTVVSCILTPSSGRFPPPVACPACVWRMPSSAQARPPDPLDRYPPAAPPPPDGPSRNPNAGVPVYSSQGNHICA